MRTTKETTVTRFYSDKFVSETRSNQSEAVNFVETSSTGTKAWSLEGDVKKAVFELPGKKWSSKYEASKIVSELVSHLKNPNAAFTADGNQWFKTKISTRTQDLPRVPGVKFPWEKVQTSRHELSSALLEEIIGATQSSMIAIENGNLGQTISFTVMTDFRVTGKLAPKTWN